MTDEPDDDGKSLSTKNLPMLDSESGKSSENSSVISTISNIRISKKKLLTFDGMIGDSECESEDDSQTSRELPTITQNKMQDDFELEKRFCLSEYEKQHSLENQQVNEVKLLGSVNRSTLDLGSSINDSGLTTFLNISGVTENIPISFSELQLDTFETSEAQDEEENDQIIMSTQYDEGEDFSPSDGSDFDPKTAYISDDNITEDEYYDDPMVSERKKRDKRHCEESRKIQNRIKEKESVSLIGDTEDLEEINDKGNDFRKRGSRVGKRSWDRRNACFYCQELVTNFSRHLLRRHANEIEVIQYKSINDQDLKIRKLKRQAITEKLRNKGNFLHNSKVTFDRDVESTIIPKKRNTQKTSSPSTFATCKICLGTFKRSTFFRHFRNCHSENDGNRLPSLKRRVLYNHSITIIPNTASASAELKDNVLSRLRSDDISLVVKNDPLILAYGSRLLKKKKERRSRKAICSKMRDLATLLNILRTKDNSIESLTDALEPEKYEIFIDAIKTMCGFDEQTGAVKIPSIPARMRPAILGCIDILYTQVLMSTESTANKEAYKKKLGDFKRLIEINWQWEISSNAEKTRKRINMTKENVIPLDEDIAIVMNKIQKLELKYSDKLRKDRDAFNYETLCVVTIAHIIMLDRKRAGDVAEAELTFYINRKNEEVPQKVLQTLTSQQKKSIEDLDVFQIPGKRTRAVPILLTKTMRENIDLIIACREDLNIPSSNPYLFARPSTTEPFDGGKCLENIKKRCNLKRPELITSTGMRHHIATMSQIHAKQNDHYTEQLAGFLGHDMAVHAKNYRLPMQVLQKAVVGTHLIEYETTTKTKNKPNRTETLTSPPENLDENEDNVIDNTEKPIDENETATETQNKQDNTEIKTSPVENLDENQDLITMNTTQPEIKNERPRRIKKKLNENNCAIENKQKSNKRNENNNEKVSLPNRKLTKRQNQVKLNHNSQKNKPKQYKVSSSSNSGDEDESKTTAKPQKNLPKKKKHSSSESYDDEKPKSKKKGSAILSKKKDQSCLASSSNSEGEDSEDSLLRKRKKIVHKKWSDEEINAVKKHLQTYINRKTNPGKAKCMAVLKKEPVLKNRTWMQLNSYVNNIYKNK